MTYCVGIWTKSGLVMASDSRTDAGHDQVNVSRKMHTFVQPGERVCFRARRPLEPSQLPPSESIEPVEPGPADTAGAELQPQAKPPSS